MKHNERAQILSPRSTMAPRPMMGILLFASIVVVGNSLVAAPQKEALRAENPGALPGSAEGTPSDSADPGYWIGRARKAGAEMQEKVADEKSIFQSLVSRALLKSGQAGEATEVALSFDPLTRVNALLSIAAIQADAEDPESVKKTLVLVRQEMASMKRTDPEVYGREVTNWTRHILGMQCELGEVAGAFKTLESITPDLDKESFHFTDAGPVTVPAGSCKANALAEIAVNQARLGDAAGAKKTALSIPLEDNRDAALWMVADVLAEEGHVKPAQGLADEIKARVTDREVFVFAGEQPIALPVSFFASNALAALAKAHGGAGDFAAAGGVIESIPREETRLEALQELVGAMSRAGRFAEAKKSAASFASPASRDRTWWAIGTEQAKQGDLAGAGKTADEITDKALGAIVYCEIANGLFKGGKEKEARGMLKTAEGLLAKRDALHQIPLLWRIGRVYCEAGNNDAGRAVFETAVQLSSKIEEEGIRQQAFLRIAENQLEGGELEGSKRTLDRIKEAGSKIRPLITVAVHEHKAGEEKAARQTFRDAFEAALSIDSLLWIEDPRSKAATLRSLGNAMAQARELKLVSQFAEEAKGAHSRAPAYLFLGAAEGLIEGKE